MSVPYLAGAIRGWTKKRTIQIVTKDFSTGLNVETLTPVICDINIQPMPPQRIDRKPEEQRAWKWWTVIIKGSVLFKPDDIFILNDVRYRIEIVHDWSESGFRKYEAVEDYQEDVS